ncbi:uncharacterized protein LOC142324991 [Lycorma delicatula]|uniref:uncharacterized protein LOC142324991 n=1 Tax=Lycorma delicatula TaxID=130591 RepID=UPI003F518D43
MMISLGGLKLLTVLVLAAVLSVKGQWNPSFGSNVFTGAGRQPQGFDRQPLTTWQSNRLTRPTQTRQVTTATGNRRPETGSTRQPSPNDVDSNNQNIPNYSGPVFLVPCKCPTAKNFDPVCGTDNRTYVNRSTLDCNNRCGVNVNFKRRGSCAANRT